MIGWLRRWGWVVGVVALAVLVWVVTRGRSHPPMDELRAAVDAARADERAERMAAELGHQEAVRRIEEDYRETIEQLDREEREQAERLSKDARARARFYARVARRHSGRSSG